jgi:hypothetical protein
VQNHIVVEAALGGDIFFFELAAVQFDTFFWAGVTVGD